MIRFLLAFILVLPTAFAQLSQSVFITTSNARLATNNPLAIQLAVVASTNGSTVFVYDRNATDATNASPTTPIIKPVSYSGRWFGKVVGGGNGTGDLLSDNNLSDVDSPSTALANLGGVAAVNGTASGLTLSDATAKRRAGFNASKKPVSMDGSLDMLLFGAAADGSTDDTSVFTTAKSLAGTNGVVYFPAKSTGSRSIYYFSATLDLTGCRIATDSGVVLSVGNSTGIDYRSILATTDIVVTNRAKTKQYTLPKNTGIFSMQSANVPRETYSAFNYLTFSDFTAGQMGFASATPSSPGVAFTTTTNTSTIETATVATTNYLGHWIRPKVGRTFEMTFSTVAAQTSGHAQAVILDSAGTAYVGVEVIDADNTLKSLTHEVNLVSMTNGVRSRTSRISVRNETWELGKNAAQGRSVLVGVKMISPTTAQFFVNKVLMGTLSLGNNADRIFFAMNGAYSGGLNGFYDPMYYDDANQSKPRTLNIATFGDSVTAGSHTTLPWPEHLARDLNGQEGIGWVNVTNYGHSGDTSGDQVTVMSGVTLSAFTDVVVFIGINDIAQATLRSTFESNIAYLIQTPLSAGCNVVVAVPPMFSTGGTADVRGLIRGIVQRVAATKQGSGTVRVANVLGYIGDQIDNLGVGDLVHPTVDGNRVNSQIIAREIAKIYQSNQPQAFKNIRTVNGSLVMQGTAAPTTGYFYLGDFIENSNPSSGSYRGWICTASGSPGTWVECGYIGTPGDVTAASSFGVDNRIIRSDGTGKGVQVSGVTIDDSGNYVSSGTITISGAASVADDPYNATSWNGSTQVPTKNAVRDKIESLSQTPWSSDIDGGGNSLTNIASVQVGTGQTNGFFTLWGSGAGVGWTSTNNANGNYRLSLPASGLSGLVEFLFVGTNVTMVARTNVYEFALSDETTAITTGTAKLTWFAPHSMTIKDVRASLSTQSSSGNPAIDINEGGVSIFSTTLTIDANEDTSTTAATPYVLSDTSIAETAKVTFDIDTAGTGAKGLKVKIYYTRP